MGGLFISLLGLRPSLFLKNYAVRAGRDVKRLYINNVLGGTL